MKYYPAFYKRFKSFCQVLDQSFRFYLEHTCYEKFCLNQVKKNARFSYKLIE